MSGTPGFKTCTGGWRGAGRENIPDTEVPGPCDLGQGHHCEVLRGASPPTSSEGSTWGLLPKVAGGLCLFGEPQGLCGSGEHCLGVGMRAGRQERAFLSVGGGAEIAVVGEVVGGRGAGTASGNPTKDKGHSALPKVWPMEHSPNNFPIGKGSRSSKFEKHWVEHHPTSVPRVPPGAVALSVAGHRGSQGRTRPHVSTGGRRVTSQALSRPGPRVRGHRGRGGSCGAARPATHSRAPAPAASEDQGAQRAHATALRHGRSSTVPAGAHRTPSHWPRGPPRPPPALRHLLFCH